ncbi:unnamed protein product [Acanthoscelides obtectus]|uniref:Uncharacterized protein n=1 Tax=Acanthoscelides obtectus TaxID=200917 RepID=A0A9P0QAR2_ACAOB|nr:unnamed protein product [Acanthoscelides obtectus]CAK1630449.1 hypothetical protein AOBTE_LOCUS6337 [Acanthoscelides obtectus]
MRRLFPVLLTLGSSKIGLTKFLLDHHSSRGALAFRLLPARLLWCKKCSLPLRAYYKFLELSSKTPPRIRSARQTRHASVAHPNVEN